VLLDRLYKTAVEQGLVAFIEIVVADLNMISIENTFDMIMAHHSLHHIQALENVFEYCYAHLRDGGIFASNDMIGRNGHTRWPEARAVLNALWPSLSPKQRYHAQLKRTDDTFIDHDCSTEGFEGIRAQDILPLLLKIFYPYKFHAFGGFIDVFVDRGYGHGYDVNDRNAVAFIQSIADLNEIMLDVGTIKPTAMMAYFTKEQRTEVFYRARRAAACVRWPHRNPPWTQYYPAPPGSE
jgi:SAM-dependent methyltransferase